MKVKAMRSVPLKKIFHLIIVVFLAWFLLWQNVQAKPQNLAAAINYLRNLTLASAEFTQTNHDGTKSTGRMLLKKPGRLRFEYQTPKKDLVLVSGAAVYVFDVGSNQPPQRFPLDKSPLRLFLDRNFSQQTVKEVLLDFKSDDQLTQLVLKDPQDLTQSTLVLVLNNKPRLHLRGWVVFEGSGQRTVTLLDKLYTPKSIGDNAFSVPYAIDNFK